MTFHSGIMNSENELRSKMKNRLGRAAHAYLFQDGRYLSKERFGLQMEMGRNENRKLRDVFISYKRQKLGYRKPSLDSAPTYVIEFSVWPKEAALWSSCSKSWQLLPLICTTMFRARLAPSLFVDAREL